MHAYIHVCATKCEKCEEGKAYVHVLYTLKEFRRCERGFAPHRTQGYDSFSRRPCALFAMLGTTGLSRTHRSRHELHDIVVAFTLSVFSSVFVSGS